MSLQVLPLSTSEWPRHGKPETEFLQGLLHSGSRWGVFLQLHRVRMRPQSRVGNVSLLSSRVHITGTCYTPSPRPGIHDLALAL